MLKPGRVTKFKMLFILLVFVFNFDLFKFSAAILEKGLFTADSRSRLLVMIADQKDNDKSYSSTCGSTKSGSSVGEAQKICEKTCLVLCNVNIFKVPVNDSLRYFYWLNLPSCVDFGFGVIIITGKKFNSDVSENSFLKQKHLN